VQDKIADDPSILGLGEIVLQDKERRHPKAGRLDLLLQDPESNTRYEVEVQLGEADESHIIRTLEYWDIERKRYPQYDHVAVIVAEDITSRFLNVIGLFNGAIPLVAIQMNALRYDGKVGLLFTTVLDQMMLGLVDEDEDVQEKTDRAYWESKQPKEIVALADKLLEIAKQFDETLELAYNKRYIGLTQNGIKNNMILFQPWRKFIRMQPRMKRSPELEEKVEQSGLDTMVYNTRNGRYAIRLTAGEIESNREVITEILRQAIESGS